MSLKYIALKVQNKMQAMSSIVASSLAGLQVMQWFKKKKKHGRGERRSFHV